ncbi:hypothetical protein L3V86_04320 [Thiotrichales bacterium 19S11-10]|nr:hypothetical protein [Thiotrichales bacterium 19S11-10]
MGVVIYKIEANDKDITKTLNDHLISLTINDSIGDNADSINLSLDDAKNQIEFPKAGAELKVSLGTKNNLHSFGVFVVDHVSYKIPPATIEISAKSVPFNKSKQFQPMQSKKNRSFDQTTLGEIIKQIANEHGLTSSIAPEIESINIEHIDQTNESNVGFLYRLARLYNGKLKLTYEKIILLKDNGKTVSGKDISPIELELTELTNLSYSAQKKISFKSVIAQYHNLDTGKTEEITVGSGSPVMRTNYLYPDKDQAQKMAEKVLSKTQDDSDELNFTIIGDVRLIAGVPITIKKLRDDIPNGWVIKTANHTLSESGYLTNISANII